MGARKSSKYNHIYEEIRAGIVGKQFAPGDQLPTEYELCRRYSVSRPTVTRALNMLQSEGLVHRRSGSGSYVSTVPEQRLETSHMYFGLLIPKLGVTEIFEPICASIAQQSRANKFHILWGDSAAHGDVSVIEAAEDTCRRYIEANVSGVFFVPLELVEGHREANQRIAETLEEANVPVVMLDADYLPFPERSRFDLVGIDNVHAGYRLTRHFLDQGARRVDYLYRHNSAQTIFARIRGYRSALFDAGIVPSDSWIHELEPGETESVRALLDSGATDIVCANDATAFTLLHSLEELGVRVPEDIRLTGVDDVKYSKYARVPLTTIQQPCETIGRLAVLAMMSRLRNPDAEPFTISAHSALMERRSSSRSSVTILQG
ncbi:MAG: GntR family transcriptional regulator [Spirochaetales bacterium]